jgi:hypothetical protein
MAKYVGRRAREFDLRFVPYSTKAAALIDKQGNRAYLLLKRVDIKPRPYLEPAAKDAAADSGLSARLKLIYGSTNLPFEVTRS